MPVLDPSEYDASYFDGRLQTLKHNAGYGRYFNWQRFDGAGSTGSWWGDYAAGWLNQLSLSGKKVLEIGCAKGFFVEQMVDAGVDAYGLDVSDWCINSCNQAGTDQAAVLRRPDLAARFTVGDATSPLPYANNEFDWVVSFRFLECIADADLPGVISEMNRVVNPSRNQVHVVDDFTGEQIQAAAYYNAKTQAEWAALADWPRNVRIVDHDTQAVVNT